MDPSSTTQAGVNPLSEDEVNLVMDAIVNADTTVANSRAAVVDPANNCIKRCDKRIFGCVGCMIDCLQEELRKAGLPITDVREQAERYCHVKLAASDEYVAPVIQALQEHANAESKESPPQTPTIPALWHVPAPAIEPVLPPVSVSTSPPETPTAETATVKTPIAPQVSPIACSYVPTNKPAWAGNLASAPPAGYGYYAVGMFNVYGDFVGCSFQLFPCNYIPTQYGSLPFKEGPYATFEDLVWASGSAVWCVEPVVTLADGGKIATAFWEKCGTKPHIPDKVISGPYSSVLEASEACKHIVSPPPIDCSKCPQPPPCPPCPTTGKFWLWRSCKDGNCYCQASSLHPIGQGDCFLGEFATQAECDNAKAAACTLCQPSGTGTSGGCDTGADISWGMRECSKDDIEAFDKDMGYDTSKIASGKPISKWVDAGILASNSQPANPLDFADSLNSLADALISQQQGV